jgi:predicted amidophosphoribosyltransferase
MPRRKTTHGMQRVCPYCNKYVKENAVVCPSCGRRLDRGSAFSWFTNMSLTGKIIVVVVAVILLKIVFS